MTGYADTVVAKMPSMADGELQRIYTAADAQMKLRAERRRSGKIYDHAYLDANHERIQDACVSSRHTESGRTYCGRRRDEHER